MHSAQSELVGTEVVTAKAVSDAQAALDKARAYLDEALALQSSIGSRHDELTRLAYCRERTKAIRQRLDAWTTRGGGLALGLIASCSVIVVVCHALGLHPILTSIPVLAVCSSLGYFGIRLFKPTDAQLEAELAAWGKGLDVLKRQAIETETILTKARERYDQADSRYQSVVREFQSRLNQLRSTDWRVLQAIPFENFVAEVLREWGYQIETTKVTGDQGVDLIATRNGVRTAIQAKGFLSSTVGNSAIQQAYTGMTIYNCQQCAVITNSTFTSGARQAAEAVGCVLVDGDAIPLLINGQSSV
jgi:hypothetical protein